MRNLIYIYTVGSVLPQCIPSRHFICMCVLGIESTTFALLMQCCITESQEQTAVFVLSDVAFNVLTVIWKTSSSDHDTPIASNISLFVYICLSYWRTKSGCFLSDTKGELFLPSNYLRTQHCNELYYMFAYLKLYIISDCFDFGQLNTLVAFCAFQKNLLLILGLAELL